MSASAPGFSLSATAARRIAEIAAAEGRPFLRVAVKGGGCSGFSYVFQLADAAEDDDLVVERDGARVLVDEASLAFLGGAELDFADELIGAAFRVNNPNAKSGCGCGTSFSL